MERRLDTTCAEHEYVLCGACVLNVLMVECIINLNQVIRSQSLAERIWLKSHLLIELAFNA